jgi:MerR family Zn(II)-responsive transcriptional regulator of zntA
MHIGAIAKKAGLSARTIRYYEELGLIGPSGRSRGGFRQYEEETLKNLELIGFLKGLDLTLLEIRQIFRTGKDPDKVKEDLRQSIGLLGGKLRLITSRLDMLAKMKRDLAAALDVLLACESCGQNVPLRAAECEDCIRLRRGRIVSEVLKALLEGNRGRTL